MSLLDNSKSLEYIDHYCNDASYKKNLAKNTLQAYKSDLTVFLKWLVLRNHDLLHVDRILINNYLASKLDNGSTVSTIQRTITCIKSFYAFLQNKEIIKDNPAILIENPKKKEKITNYYI